LRAIEVIVVSEHGPESTRALRLRKPECILVAVLTRLSILKTRLFNGMTAAFAVGIMVFGVVAAPFCRCTCSGHGWAAAAAGPSCREHANHHCKGGNGAAPARSCDHAACAGITVMPQEVSGSSLLMSRAPAPPGHAIFLARLALHAVPGGQLMVTRASDRDVGPAIPLPLFSILRS
jgi:hypothetical protein